MHCLLRVGGSTNGSGSFLVVISAASNAMTLVFSISNLQGIRTHIKDKYISNDSDLNHLKRKSLS